MYYREIGENKSRNNLKMKIEALRGIQDAGVDLDIFERIIKFIGNGSVTAPPRTKNLTIEDWVLSYSDEGINKEGLKLVFEYLLEYHPGIVFKNEAMKYHYQYKNIDENDFIFEYGILYALKIAS